MMRKWPLPKPPPPGLPVCFHPGCRRPAPYGYGCTLRSLGQHFCEEHRPEVLAASERSGLKGRR